MRAVVIREAGGPEVLQYVKDYPRPPPSAGEALIRIVSTSVNPVDYKVRGRPGPRPKILGGDVAGYVEKEGAQSKFKEGDRVFALTPTFFGGEYGSYAEYAAVDEDHLARVPANLPLSIAGAVPLASLTAFQALSTADLAPGQRVLVHAGAGGVGMYACQLAKAQWRAYVVATAGARNLDFLRQELGVDEAVDYKGEDFAEMYADTPFDAIVDLVGGDTELRSYDVLAPGGTFAHIRNTGTDMARVEAGKAWGDGKKYTYTIVAPNGAQLQTVSELIAAGKVRVVVDRVLPLEDAKAAHIYVEGGPQRGKVVLKVSDE